LKTEVYGPLSQSNEQKAEQKHSERREQIKKAALKVFAHRGFVETKMTMIATEAGISQGLSYRYFKSKDQLYTELIREAMEEANKAIRHAKHLPGTPIEQIRALTREIMEESNKLSFLLIQQTQTSDEVPKEAKQMIEQYSQKDTIDQLVPIFIEGQKLGEFCEGDPLKLLFIYFSVITGLMLLDVQLEENYWQKELDILMKILKK
jgi:TetR/AcrR family transcriptional regulator, regulator of autoinduction and epiphytic fitness